MLSLCLMILETDEDAALFTQLYVRCERKLYAVALSILKNPRAAEDMVGDAFLKIAMQFEKNASFFQKPCQEIDGWCVVMVRNLSISRLRKERRLTELDERWDPPAPEDAESIDAYHRLVALIRALPETYRTVLELRFALEWSTADIARRLHIRENTVSARISRGRRLLLEKLREEGYCDADGQPL